MCGSILYTTQRECRKVLRRGSGLAPDDVPGVVKV